MKSRNTPNYIIAAVVIVCSVVLLAALTLALYGFQWKPKGRTLEIDFRDSTGIRLHSAVRYAGAVAGSVTQIRYLSAEERRASKDKRNAVRVTIALHRDVPPIPADVRATLAAETILGEKFISLAPDDPDAAALPDGAVIQGVNVIAFDALARTAQRTAENLNEILARFNRDYPDLIPKVSGLLSQGKAFLLEGSNFVHSAGGAVTNANQFVTQFRSDYGELVEKVNALLSQGKNVATNADKLIQGVNSFVSRADGLIKTNEGNLHQLLAEFRVVSQNLKVISTYAKALTSTLGERPSRLIWGTKKTPLPSEQQILESPEPIPIERPPEK